MFLEAGDGIRVFGLSSGLGDVYKDLPLCDTRKVDHTRIGRGRGGGILGPDGPSALNCGSMLVDVKVDVGRFFVAEGRACWGRVNNDMLSNTFSKVVFQKVENSIKESRVW